MSDERLEESSVSQGHSAACLAEESDFNREMRRYMVTIYVTIPPPHSVSSWTQPVTASTWESGCSCKCTAL